MIQTSHVTNGVASMKFSRGQSRRKWMANQIFSTTRVLSQSPSEVQMQSPWSGAKPLEIKTLFWFLVLERLNGAQNFPFRTSVVCKLPRYVLMEDLSARRHKTHLQSYFVLYRRIRWVSVTKQSRPAYSTCTRIALWT